MNKAILAGGLLAVLAWPAAGGAQVTETSTIANSWNYNVGGQSGSGSNAGGVAEVFQSVAGIEGISELGLSLTGTLDNGSFFFLHNGVCVGQCSVTLSTQITFTLTNTGTAPVDLRFDSQITPGHLGSSYYSLGSDSQAEFNFAVSAGGTNVAGVAAGALFGAFGDAANRPPVVFTTDQSQFNGFNLVDNAPEWSVADWSATNLSVNVPTLGAGQSTILTYSSTLTINTYQTDCPQPNACESYQVAFGDPRNAGGVINDSLAASAALDEEFSAFSALLAPLATVGGLSPAVGAPFDPFKVTYQFVPQGSPLPPTPPVIGPINYDINYPGQGVGAVPEPATWAMLVLGFGLIGGLLRRHRRAGGGVLRPA